MATNLTGDFDVIAQFALPAVNRVLAAMHTIERFQHSIAFRVDDIPRAGDDRRPSVIAVIDAFGDTLADHMSIRNPRPLAPGLFGGSSTTSAAIAALDAIANIDVVGVDIGPIQPSNLKGRAQLQLFPPTLEIPDASGRRLTVRIEIIARYIPDPGTPKVAEFVRGSLTITTEFSQVLSQVGNLISIDVKSSSAIINFTPTWSSTPISAEDLAGISLLIRNALKTSFLPSNATLPSQIGHIQFKTMSGSNGAVAVMLDMDGPAGNPGSASQVFISGSDGFAFGIGADYVQTALRPTLDKILEQQVDPVKFDIDGWLHTWHITYVITLNNASLELQNGKMVLVIKGHAHTGTSWMPDFDFTLKQDMTIAVWGDSAELVFGNMSIDTSSTIVNIFKSGAMSNLARVRDRAMAASGAQATIAKMLSAEQNLGGFLRSILTPANTQTPAVPLRLRLDYSSAEIRESGIILHGNVSVPLWPPPRVEYEPIPITDTAPGHHLPTDAIDNGPDYSALKSWIPGGTIERFEWHKSGQTGYSDEHRFVLLHQEPSATMAMSAAAVALAGYSPMCLTIYGRRISPVGPSVTQSVSGTICGYRSFPVGDFAITDGLVVLARRSSSGHVDVIGHAAPMAATADSPSPNLIVHFADESAPKSIEGITEALRTSGRADAATAIVMVAKSAQVSMLPYSDNVTYAVDDGSWRRRYGIDSQGSATVVVKASGELAWRKLGAVDPRELAEILGKTLERTPQMRATMLTSHARIGRQAPNFLFEHAPGQQVTLRKITGRPVVIVFFNSKSEASLDAVHDAVRAAGEKGSSDPIVLAVMDGGSNPKTDLSPAILIPDRDNSIAKAFGVTMWPTIVTIDETGIVRGIAYGRLTRGEKSRA